MLTYALLLPVSVERARDRRGAVNLLKGPERAAAGKALSLLALLVQKYTY